MSDDFKLPDLPSDEELGIDDDDLEEFLEDEGSELTAAEMKALLGESPPPKAPRAQSGTAGKKPAEKRAKKKPAKKRAGLGGLFRRKPKAEAPPAGAAAGAPTGAPRATGESPAPGGEAAGSPPPGDGDPPQKEKKAPPQPEAEGPPSRWRGPVTLALLALATWMGSTGPATPRPVPANAPDTAFSSARAMAHVVEIARSAHPPGSPEHDRVRAYIMDRLTDLGFEPQVQTATALQGYESSLRAVTVRNIVARLPGTASTGAVLVTTHYDGRGISRAAADAGAGVVAILESLRALQAGEALQNDLIVLITDAEELGLMGAQAFVRDHPLMADVQAVISIEMRGAGGPSIMFETGPDFGWILDAYKRGAPRPVANSMAYEVYQRMPNRTDLTRFLAAEKQGLNFAAIGRSHIYHQVYDSPENLSEATLQHHGLNVLSMIRTLGDEDLTDVRGPDLVYRSLPGLGLVTYPASWVWPLTGALLAAWLVILLLGRIRGLSIAGSTVGLMVPVLVGGAGFAVATWGRRRLAAHHPELGAIQGSAFHSEGWYVLALVALLLALFTALWGLARNRYALRDLAAGASLPAVAAVVGITYLMPLGAMNLQWPLAAFLVALAATTLLPATGLAREIRWFASVLCAMAALLVLTFVVELLWQAMTLWMLPYLAVLVTLTLVLVIPALDALRQPNAWFGPAAGTLLFLVFLAAGLLQARPSPQRPLPSTLIYALDAGEGSAVWATQPARSPEDPARAWAEAQVSASFSGEEPLTAFLAGSPEAMAARWLTRGATGGTTYAVADAPVIDASPPEVNLVAYSTYAGQRAVRIALRSTLGAEVMVTYLPDSVELLRVNDLEVPMSSSVVEHWGRPDSAVFLDIRLPASDTVLAFAVVEHHLRPGELVGEETFQRPPNQAANINALSDRALIRTPVRLSLEGVPATAVPDSLPSVPGSTEAGPTDSTEPDSAAVPDTTSVPAAPTLSR